MLFLNYEYIYELLINVFWLYIIFQELILSCSTNCGNDFLTCDKIIISGITKAYDDNGFTFLKKSVLPTNIGIRVELECYT